MSIIGSFLMKNWRLNINIEETHAIFYHQADDAPISKIIIAYITESSLRGIGFVVNNKEVFNQIAHPLFRDIYSLSDIDYFKELKNIFCKELPRELSALEITDCRFYENHKIFDLASTEALEVLAKIDPDITEIIKYLNTRLREFLDAKNKVTEKLTTAENLIFKESLNNFLSKYEYTRNYNRTANALPLMLNAVSAFEKRTDRPCQFNPRDFLLFNLKYCILHRIEESKRNGVNLPANLAEKVFEYLINVSLFMTKKNTNAITLTDMYTPTDLNRLQLFFGDPSAGKNLTQLGQLKMIREHAQDFLEHEDNTWVMPERYREVLCSLHVVELSKITSGLQANGIPQVPAEKKAMEEFTKMFFADTEAHLSYVYKVGDWEPDLFTPAAITF